MPHVTPRDPQSVPAAIIEAGGATRLLSLVDHLNKLGAAQAEEAERKRDAKRARRHPKGGGDAREDEEPRGFRLSGASANAHAHLCACVLSLH
eukprot:247377-Prymnesium_polylepis.1